MIRVTINSNNNNNNNNNNNGLIMEERTGELAQVHVKDMAQTLRNSNTPLNNTTSTLRKIMVMMDMRMVVIDKIMTRDIRI